MAVIQRIASEIPKQQGPRESSLSLPRATNLCTAALSGEELVTLDATYKFKATVNTGNLHSVLQSGSAALPLAAQQAMLEVAMRRHGPSTECRWDRIAEDVAGMSTNDCLERYKRLCHAVREKQHAATRWPFAVVTVPHKGFGCRALRNIVRGERLIAERPLITRGPDSRPLAELVAALSGRDRAAFFSLSQNAARFGETKTAEGVFATNALPNHDFAQEFEAVFAVVSRFNHACDANACFRWNRTLGMMTVHATRNIRPNEEVTINYGFPSGCVLRDQRRARLRQSFGFECACQQCTLSGEQLQRSEQLCAAIGDTTSLISELCVWGSLPTLVCVEATSVLRRLEARHALIREHSSRGHRRHRAP